MNVLVVGLGALGTVYACLLKNKGHHVTALARPGAVDIIRKEGVLVQGIWGEHQAFLDNIVGHPKELQGSSFDLIILTIKSFDTEQVVQDIKGLFSPHTYLALLQNGYGNYETAAQYIPEEQLLLGRVIFGAETLNLGQSKVTVIADDVIIGSPRGLIPQNVTKEFAGIFAEAGIPTRASDDVMKYLWGKIIYNSALNPLGALFEVNYGKLVEIEESNRLLEQIIREIFLLLKKIGQQTLWPNVEAYLKDFYGVMVPTTVAHHPSMLQDIQRGRRTEIDSLNGAMVELGEKFNLDLPVNRVITAMLKAKEQMRIK